MASLFHQLLAKMHLRRYPGMPVVHDLLITVATWGGAESTGCISVARHCRMAQAFIFKVNSRYMTIDLVF